MSKPIKIEIQICSNCKSHEWCTRHKEANYSSLAAEISKAIKDHNNDIDVQIVPVGGSKMGSFQISCNGTILFSKLKLGYFPHVPSATSRILSFVDDYQNGRDIKKYTEAKGVSPNKTMHSTNSNGFNYSQLQRSKSKSPEKKIKINQQGHRIEKTNQQKQEKAKQQNKAIKQHEENKKTEQAKQTHKKSEKQVADHKEQKNQQKNIKQQSLKKTQEKHNEKQKFKKTQENHQEPKQAKKKNQQKHETTQPHADKKQQKKSQKQIESKKHVEQVNKQKKQQIEKHKNKDQQPHFILAENQGDQSHPPAKGNDEKVKTKTAQQDNNYKSEQKQQNSHRPGEHANIADTDHVEPPKLQEKAEDQYAKEEFEAAGSNKNIQSKNETPLDEHEHKP